MWLYSLPGLGDLHEIYIFSHFLHSSCPNFYRNVLKIQKCVTCNQARSIFGFKGEDNIGWATVYYSNIILDWVSVCIHCIFFLIEIFIPVKHDIFWAGQFHHQKMAWEIWHMNDVYLGGWGMSNWEDAQSNSSPWMSVTFSILTLTLTLERHYKKGLRPLST